MVTEKRPDQGLNAAVSAVLRGERAASGLTIEQLAAKASLSTPTVQRLLSNRRGLTIDYLERLCGALDLSPVHVLALAVERHTADPDLVRRIRNAIMHRTPPRGTPPAGGLDGDGRMERSKHGFEPGPRPTPAGD